MIRATKVIPAEQWSHAATDIVVLTYDDRHRRRLAMKGKRGVEFLLDLPDATALRNGDGLVLEDGRMVEVHAKPEPLLLVTAMNARDHGARSMPLRRCAFRPHAGAWLADVGKDKMPGASRSL